MSDDKERALAAIESHLATLRERRPSTQSIADRSAKGARTIATILNAAREVFVEDGHAGLSLRKVAERAGVAVGNVSYYFPSKRALLDAMLREILADYVEEHTEQFEAARDAPMDILLNVVTFYVANGRFSHTLFFQIWGYAGADAEARRLVSELYRSIGQFIYFLIKAANPAIGDAQARRTVAHIFSLEEGMKLFFGLAAPDENPLPDAEHEIREMTKQMIAS